MKKTFMRKRVVTGAVASKDYEPRVKANAESVQPYDATKHFKPFAGASVAIAPEQMAQSGTAMICIAAPSTYEGARIASDAVRTEKRYGAFIERDNQLFMNVSIRGELQTELIANFIVDIGALVEKVGLDQEDTELHLEFRVMSPVGEESGSIPLKLYISGLSKSIRERWPEFHIYNIGKNAEKSMQEYFSRKYAESKKSLPHRKVYKCAGWTENRKYLSGTDDNCESERRIPDVSGLSVRTNYQYWNGKILGLSDDRKIFVMEDILFHTDVLIKLFDDAGSPIQHMIAKIGPTGSRKTAVTRVLQGSSFGINTVVNFTASDAGINLMAKSRCRDSTLVLDNLSNAMDRTMLHKLNQFLLQFGDSDGRIKTENAGRELVQNEMRCSVVVTAESLLQCLQQSNLLRMLTIPYSRNSINNDVLANLQRDRIESRINQHPAGLDQYKAAFIRYVEAHYIEIVEFVSFFQPPAMSLRFARHARTYKNLVAIATIILNFGVECGALSMVEKEELFKKMWLPAIQEIMQYNEMICYSGTPYKLFLEAVRSGVAQKLIPVALNREVYQNQPAQNIGFWDGRVLKLDPARTYGFVVNYYRAKGFTATDLDIWTALRDKGISEGYVDKSKKSASLFKKVKVNGAQIDMLCLRWDEVEKVMLEEEN